MNCWNIKLSGDVDIFVSEEIKKNLLELIIAKPLNLKINCCDLKFIDSTILGVFVNINKEMEKFNGKLYFLNLPDSLAKLFKITNLDEIFIIGDSNER